MTSKEAIELIIEKLERPFYEDCNCLEEDEEKAILTIEKDLDVLEKYKRVMCKPILDIMKDLEVLEILKPMLKVEKGETWWYLDTKHCFFENEEQIKKIKEWLNEG